MLRICGRVEPQVSIFSKHFSGRIEWCLMRVLMIGFISVSRDRKKMVMSFMVIVSSGFLISVSLRIHLSL